MTEQSKNGFLTLSKQDSLKRIELLTKGNRIAIKSHDTFFHVELIEINGDEISFKEDVICDLTNLENESLLISFFVSGIRYFAKAISKDQFKLEIISNLYRDEKREEERLLLFPHHRAYAHLSIILEEKLVDNVVSISRGNRIKEEHIDEFVSLEKNELTKNKIGFRAIDISKNGVSVLANKYEVKIIEELKSFENVVFVLNNYYYEVEKIDYKYTVDYINSHSKGMFKVGFSMTSKKEKLQNKIERFIIASNKFEYSLLDDQ